MQKGNVRYTYDANGNRVRESTLNASGKETAWVRYEYNALDQLVAIYSSEQTTDDGILRSYGYDAEGNRLYEQRYYLSAYAYEIEYDTFKEVKVRGDLLEFLLAFGDDKYYYRRYVVEDPFYETPVEPVNVAEPLPEEEKEPSTSGSDGEGVNTPGEEMPSTPVSTGEEKTQESGKSPCFFWYGFGQGVARTAILPPLNEWLSQLWNLLWRFPAEKNEEKQGGNLPTNGGTTTGEDNPDGIVDLIPPTTPEEPTSPVEPPEEQNASEPNISVLHEWVPPVLGFGWLYGEIRSVWVPDETISETLVETYTTYDLIWYVNDVNREHTEVLLTKDESNAFTRRYTYGNERISWEYLSNNTAGQYIHDGRGSATMLLNSKTSAVQANHYYSVYGEVQSIWSLKGTPQAGMWDGYRYNAEDYDDQTGLSYLRARYLSNDTASFMTVDLYLGNLAEPLSLNLYMYVQGNPVRWVDPSGHWAADAEDTYGMPIRAEKPKPAVPPPNSSLNWNETSHTRLEVQESMISEVNSRGGLVIPQVPEKPMKQTKNGDETWNEVWTNAAKELGSKCDTLGDGPSKNQRLTILMVAYSFMRTDIPYGRDHDSKSTAKGVFKKIDCSQLTQYAYSVAGITITGNANEQYKELSKNRLISKDELIPGDLVFWYYDDDKKIGHSAIYVGKDDNGKIYCMESGSAGVTFTKEWRKLVEDTKDQYHYIYAYGRPKA